MIALRGFLLYHFLVSGDCAVFDKVFPREFWTSFRWHLVQHTEVVFPTGVTLVRKHTRLPPQRTSRRL